MLTIAEIATNIINELTDERAEQIREGLRARYLEKGNELYKTIVER